MCAPVVGGALLSARRTYRDLTAHTLDRRQAIASLAATVLRDRLDHLVDVGKSLATRVRFRELVAQRRWDGAIAILKEVPRDFPDIDRLFIGDPRGILRADTPALAGVRGQDFSHRDWYRGVSRAWEPYVSEVYRRAAPPQHNVIAVAVPIRGEGATVVGILVLQIEMSALVEWSRGIDVGPAGSLYVVDRRGRLVAHPKLHTEGDPIDFSSVPAVQRLRRGERGVDVLFDPIESEELVSAYQPVPGYGWGVVVAQPEAAAFASRNASLRWLLTGYGAACLFSLALGWLILRVLAERRRTEEEIRRLNEDLRRRALLLESTNREIAAFSYSVAHDLKAPLRAMDGFSQALLEDCAERLDETGRGYLQRVRAGSQHMARLIDDLLMLSKLSQTEPRHEAVDLTSLARGILEGLRKAEPGRDVVAVVQEGLRVRGDPGLLCVALENLLGNAWKFTSRRPCARIELGAESRDGARTFYVRDDGVGFDMAHASKLFGVFQRLHAMEEFPGTGIGLATVQRVVERHGGRVWAEGASGRGATFYFTLP